jgi:uncharacterized protein YdeI (YjbR/CyaY-like superfamily)
MNATDPRVDAYFGEASAWHDELATLRTIVLDCGLTEEWKWRGPWYTFQQGVIVGIYGLKAYGALAFFKGVLLQDARGILVRPGENSQTVRQARFTSVREIAEMEPILKAYIYEAIEAQKAGLKVDLRAKAELVLAEELQKSLDEDPALRSAFDALTPGRQRAYNLYCSAPKQSKTRASRVEKCLPSILNGKGLDDL